jgi:large subunit ribosomal protein L21
MFAVIKTGGKQYLVKKDQILKVEKLDAQEGDKISFDQVLMLFSETGAKAELGNPALAGKKVQAEVIKQGRAKKIIVTKYKPKTRQKTRTGHRQPFTEVKILSV